MPLIIVITGIILLLILIAVFKLNAFIVFVIVCLFVGIAGGMELDAFVQSIQTGIGNTLTFLIMILGFGSMFGKLVTDSGAAQRITSKLFDRFATDWYIDTKHIYLNL